MNVDKDKMIPKTKVRNNFSYYYENAQKGEIFYVSDRGKLGAVLAPLSVLENTDKVKIAPPISKTEAYGMFKNRKDMKDSVVWIRKK